MENLSFPANPSDDWLMGIISTYLDDRGHEGDRAHNACVIVGFTGELSSWKRFEAEWPLVLARHGLSYLQMKEHASDPEAMRCPEPKAEGAEAPDATAQLVRHWRHFVYCSNQ